MTAAPVPVGGPEKGGPSGGNYENKALRRAQGFLVTIESV